MEFWLVPRGKIFFRSLIRLKSKKILCCCPITNVRKWKMRHRFQWLNFFCVWKFEKCAHSWHSINETFPSHENYFYSIWVQINHFFLCRHWKKKKKDLIRLVLNVTHTRVSWIEKLKKLFRFETFMSFGGSLKFKLQFVKRISINFYTFVPLNIRGKTFISHFAMWRRLWL